ncbi:MAG: dynamin family protein [Lachnospiraceae bacterium]|nr:dynamin family protein [Lachnospiraceae bacterium]
MSENKEFGYIGYQEMIADITTALESTGEVMSRLELTKQAERAKEESNRIKSHVFSVGIMGEFKRGKSTVINALLGKEIAPADVVPASATLNRITYGLTPKATIVYKDGRQEEVPVEKIADYVTKITEGAAATSELVEQAVVEYPCQFCQNNVEIIDTPGLNDDDRMDAISEAVIPKLDAVVLVVSAGSPFSKSEAEFVRNKLMTSDVTRLIVLVNRIDTIYSEKDRVKLLESIREKIIREILDRTASVHGDDSKIYQDTKDKLADIKLYPLSALQALVGRTEHKPELVEQSGILAFEERLSKLLTQERGVLEILRSSAVIVSLLAEGENALSLRIGALEMSTEEFLKNQKEAEAKIEELRQGKKEEQSRIRSQGSEIKKQMDGIVQEKYEDLENRISDFMGNYPISAEVLRSEAEMKAFQSKVGQDLEAEIKQALSDYAEQISVLLQESIGEERLRVEKYMGDLVDQLQVVGSKLQGDSAIGLAGTIGVDAVSNLAGWLFAVSGASVGMGLFGLGGAIEGYRAAGAKGAITGLLGGGATCYAAMMALAAMGGVTFIPFALITGVAGTMGGKMITSLIWKKDIQKKKIEEIRSGLKETAKQSVRNLREQRLLENWAKQQVETQVDLLIDQVEQDAEALISGTEDTLKSIAADIVKANQNKEQRMEEYRVIGEKMKSIHDKLVPIMKKAEDASKQMA